MGCSSENMFEFRTLWIFFLNSNTWDINKSFYKDINAYNKTSFTMSM